jgi:predicted SAM-dependent methyltransferase
MIKVNMMSGKRNWPGWVHIDGGDFPHLWSNDIHLNKFPPGTVDVIYCSHGVAYFSVSDFKLLLEAWMKALTPGGLLQIATPDFNRLITLYHAGVEFDRVKGPIFGEMKMGSSIIHHKICYDETTLTKILSQAGFVNIERYCHRKTDHPNTGDRKDFYDDQSAAYIDKCLVSLNLQCKKPLP